MIPLRLQLKNFLSYGPQLQTVDFEPYQLICLSGKNGHGKSALLDAITWALWGQARKIGGTSKADENLLRLGQTAMTVALDVVCQGVSYRIRREYSIMAGKAVTQLDFGILDASNTTIRSLTDKTIRATQEKINQCMGLDYDAFVNSAFLRQGQANEFSKKSARERKEILASILGLDRYEAMRKCATDKTRAAAQERDVLIKQVELGLEELKQKGTIQHNLCVLENDLAKLTAQEHEYSKTLENYAERKKVLAAQEQEYTRLCIVYDQLRSDQERQSSSFREKVLFWRGILRQQKELSTFQDLSHEQSELENTVQSLFTRVQAQRAIPEIYNKLKDALHKRKDELLSDHVKASQDLMQRSSGYDATIHHITQQLSELKNTFSLYKQEYLSNQEILKALSQTLPELAAITSTLLVVEKQFERRKNFYQKYIAYGNFLKKALKELQDKQKVLAETACPLCKQAITDEHSRRIELDISREARLYNHQINRLTSILHNLKLLLTDNHQKSAELKKQLETQQTAQTRYDELLKQQVKYEQLLKDLAQQRTQLTNQLNLVTNLHAQAQQEQAHHKSLEEKIAHDTYYQELSTQLTHCEQQRTQCLVDEQAYHTALEKLQLFSQRHRAYQQLMTDLALQEQRKREIHELALLLKSIKKELESITIQREQFKSVISEKIVISEHEAHYQKQIKECLVQKQAFSEQKGALEHHKALLEQREIEVQRARVKSNELDEQAQEFNAIAQALSKDGIQALLIEEAIPEIEQEANNLLARLTENQAHLRIESLRDLKSGATKETLDIKISDPMGTRPYELFSGGEAFRIDFALRVAISKLLARRAGAQLQTLIIDEGFGSQDEEGLANIMEALYKIQEDFAKIIIVSHLSAMKDQFPVHFMIHKTPQGSTVHVAQQG